MYWGIFVKSARGGKIDYGGRKDEKNRGIAFNGTLFGRLWRCS
jgi:hypothetical protein